MASRVQSYIDKARKQNAFYCEWELKLSDGAAVPDKAANFLDWRKKALEHQIFSDILIKKIIECIKAQDFGSCYAYWEACTGIPFKDWDPRPGPALLGLLHYLRKEVETEIQTLQGVPTDEKKN